MIRGCQPARCRLSAAARPEMPDPTTSARRAPCGGSDEEVMPRPYPRSIPDDQFRYLVTQPVGWDAVLMTLDRPAASPQADNERAERILEAARELLVAWGYKRVTVDEIARRARIGKGTVYLHWKTKETLFTELLRRELHVQLGTVTAGIEQDPSSALPSRLVREVFLQQARNPVARAVHAGDSEVLGALAITASGLPVIQELGFHTLLTRLVDVWRAHGLMTVTASAADQIYTIDAVLTGFITGGIAVPPGEELPPDHRADLLGHTIRTALETSATPDEATLHAAAQDVLATLAAAQDVLAGAHPRSASH
ncbi:TetR/AcrR family transcriptional regulator [Streptomyces sp. K1PN6]|uniref:TetR/AcrR family transcriptional regulator n=2 Tax=Streptomyces acidicola TaxID=2596892 RepID=A0A5N8X0B7_9ACTN|nr:TetR/AcrR family transcriptional regulator [Streptomyces acidicola]